MYLMNCLSNNNLVNSLGTNVKNASYSFHLLFIIIFFWKTSTCVVSIYSFVLLVTDIYIYIYADKYDVYINNIGENVAEQQFGSDFVLIRNTDESGRINVEHVLVETKSNTQAIRYCLFNQGLEYQN